MLLDTVKVLHSLLPFLNEMFFDSKDESDFKSSKFKPKRYAVYLGFILFGIMSVVLGDRTIRLSYRVFEAQHDLERLSSTMVEKDRDLRLHLDRLAIVSEKLIQTKEEEERCVRDLLQCAQKPTGRSR